MILSVTPNPVTEGETVTVKWAATNAAKVRMAWACGADVVNLSGTSGTFTRVAKCPGNCHIALKKADGTVIGSVDLTVNAAVANAFVPVGWGAVTTGGMGGKLFQPADWAGLKTALQTSGPRIIKIAASAGVIDGGGDEVSVYDGDFTVDGSDWTGSLKDYKIIVRASNNIWTQMRLRTGEGANTTASADRRALTFNPPSDGSISNIVIDHCSLAWGPDVIFSVLSRTSNVTMQYNIFGPAIFQSNIASSPNGYGPNVACLHTVAADLLRYPDKITYYRNYLCHIHRRICRFVYADNCEAINNVVYDFGSGSATGDTPGRCFSGNPKHANYVGNMVKKGPTSPFNDIWTGEVEHNGLESLNTNSVYFPIAGADRNIGLGFTATVDFAGPDNAGAAERSTLYGTLHAPLATADATLAAAVVAAAGPSHVDAVDQAVKADFTAGNTGSIFNGAGFPAPHPYWP